VRRLGGFAGRYVLASIILLVVVGCSGPGGAEPVTSVPLVVPRATPTPLAVESTPAGGGGGSFYKPRGWDGVSDVNCKDFDTHKHAQGIFEGTRGSRSNDPYGLDGDHDGIACETLP
jgi:hypothetical protein